jgi:hypothetical protein
MRVHGLGPHTFGSIQPHERHHAWLTSFKPRERHSLIEEDEAARRGAFTVLFGAMCFGMVSLLVVYALMLAFGLM